jgi:23S rRNA (uracil1939-C5)-methyltransferase
MNNGIPHQTPPCPHYSLCGGCNLQHLDKEYYLQMKQQKLLDILKYLGVSDKVAKPMVNVGQYARRRVDLKISVCKGKVNVGFYASKSHEVVDIHTCLIMDKKLFKLINVIRKVFSKLKKTSVIASVSITSLDSGVDILIKRKKTLSDKDIEIIKQLAENNEIIRIAIIDAADDFTVIYDSGNAVVNLDDVVVDLPVGAFLQATQKGQQAITSYVIDALKSCDFVADIYSGCGTYSFPLLKYVKQVASYEGAEDMVLAMHNAALKSGLETRINCVRRDIFKSPIKPEILNNMDGVVINPPRNGALPQVKNFVKSELKKIVMVSCNVDTFKRDAKYMIGGGYELSSVMAIDQFYWTKHLELVATFDRR